MAAGLSVAFLAGLRHRAHGLTEYLLDLQGESAGADAGYDLAVSLMSEAAQATVRMAERAVDVPGADDSAESLLSPWMAHLRLIHRQADLAFARGHQKHVRRSLLAAVDREVQDLGISNVLPVLTVGPPNNYETFVADLYDALFASIAPSLRPRRPAKSVCLISVPYVEGSRALWQPLVLGHEVAHLALRDLPAADGLDVHTWIGPGDVSNRRIKASVPARLWDPQNPEVPLLQILERWVREVLCDLRSVGRFGVAGLAAQADFLLSVGATREFETHPPGRLRIAFMLDFLGATKPGSLPAELESVVEPWRPRPLAPAPNMGWPSLLWKKLDERRDAILNAARQLPGAAYDPPSRIVGVTAHARRLEAHVPGSTPLRTAQPAFEHADILTAGWLARVAVAATPPAVDGHDPLATLDDLVGKAVDNLHFATLWTTQGQARIGPPPDPRRGDAAGAEAAPEPATAVLPRSEIVRRLRAGVVCDPDDQGDAIISTPLFPDVVAGTGMDVHLGTQFIVFRRSSTASFRSFDQSQDPRLMQELVEKDWHERFVLHPGALVLAATLEYLALPADVSAQVITRSSYGRLGLISATAVQIHPNFRGCLTLELVNLGQVPLELTPGERIAQLVFSRVTPPVPDDHVKYRFPVGPEFSKVKDDDDLKVLRKIARRASRRR